VTDAKLYRKDQLAKEGGEDVGAAMARLFRRGDDLVGMIPASLTEAPEGLVASWSGEEMERVALAIEQENAKADEEEREPNVHKALKKAHVPMEMYLQMATHPDFPGICHRVYMAFIAIPRWGGIVRAMTKAAMAGDVAAARWVRDLLASGDQAIEDAMRALEREGPEAMKRQAADLTQQLHELMAGAEKADAPAGLVEEQVQDVAVQAHQAEPELKIDLEGWTSGDET